MIPDDSGVANQSPSEMPDLVGDFDNKTGTPLSGSGESSSGDIQCSDMDAPMRDDSSVATQSPSEMPDLVGDFDRKTEMPLSGSGESSSGDIQCSDIDPPMPDDSGVANQSPLDMPLESTYSVLGYGRPNAGRFRSCKPITLGDAGPRG